MKIFLINIDGSGFSNEMAIADGATISGLFELHVGGQPGDYVIRVNREAADASYALKEGDRVSITPKKITGNYLRASAVAVDDDRQAAERLARRLKLELPDVDESELDAAILKLTRIFLHPSQV